MSTTLICNGYTAAGFLDGTKISLTSYSATYQKTLMQSQAVWQQATSVNKLIRTKGSYIQDVPVISCEISFEPNISLLKEIIDKIIEKRNSIFKVKISDSSSGIDWTFSECYIENFSFDVSMDSILSVSASFFVIPNNLSYSWGNRNNIEYGSKSLPLTTPIPYYAWKISDSSGEIKDISDFSFSFSQQITPKYSCCGKSAETTPPSASHIVFGLPNIECSIKKFIIKKDKFNLYDNSDITLHKEKIKLNSDKLLFEINGSNIFELTGVVETGSSPEFSGVPSVQTTYLVNGILK